MKKLLILLTIIIASSSAYSNVTIYSENTSFFGNDDYIDCVKKLRKEFDSINYMDLAFVGHASVYGSYASYLSYGSLNNRVRETAAILNLVMCTSISYGVSGRKVTFSYFGEIEDANRFDKVLRKSLGRE